MTAFVDPPAIGEGPLGDLSAELERATDAYVAACNNNAHAENAYLRCFHLAWLEAERYGVAATVKAKWCDAQETVTECKCAWNLTQAYERACRAKCEELRNRLNAAMSWQRVVGAQT